MIKFLLPLSLILVVSIPTFAQFRCATFNTAKVSEKVNRVTIAVENGKLGSTGNFNFLLNATLKDSSSVYSSFECRNVASGVFCGNLSGAGDFLFKGGKIPTISLSYINLAIGSLSVSGPTTPVGEINEDLAIFSIEEETESSVHPDSFTIAGKYQPCTIKDLSVSK